MSLSAIASFLDQGNLCWLATALELICNAPVWWRNLANVVDDDRLISCLCGPVGNANTMRANLVLAINELIDHPTQANAGSVTDVIQELLGVLGNNNFVPGQHADPAEMIGFISEQICELGGHKLETKVPKLIISEFTGFGVSLNPVGLDLCQMFGDISGTRWPLLSSAVEKRSNILMATPEPVQMSALGRKDFPYVTFAITADSVENRYDYQQLRHYDLTMFHPDGRIFRVDKGRCVQIAAEQLSGRSATMVLASRLDSTTLVDL